jgi:hypothetical protein
MDEWNEIYVTQPAAQRPLLPNRISTPNAIFVANH